MIYDWTIKQTGRHQNKQRLLIHIYIYTLLVCLSISLYPINVKTAEPIGPIFCIRPHMTCTIVLFHVNCTIYYNFLNLTVVFLFHSLYKMFRFSHLLLILNSSTNFVIYCLLNNDFKDILQFKFKKTIRSVSRGST